MDTLASALIAFGVSVTTPVLVIPMLRRHKVFDVPSRRSLHMTPIVRGVGITTALGVLAGWGIAVLLGRGSVWAAAIFGAALVVACIGLVEDLQGLSIRTRVIGQVTVGLGLGVAGGVSSHSWWAIPIAALGFAGYVNATNFMDGVDSISGLHGVVAGSYFCVLGGVAGHPWLQLIGGVCAAAFAGFLPWNLIPQLRVFLGDVGSYLLGGLVAGCAALSISAGLGVLLGMAPTLTYLADTTYTLIHRARRGEPLTKPHRTHVYQQLTMVGWPHIASGAIVALVTALCCAAALLAFWTVISNAVAVVGMAIMLAAYLALPHLAKKRDTSRVLPR